MKFAAFVLLCCFAAFPAIAQSQDSLLPCGVELPPDNGDSARQLQVQMLQSWQPGSKVCAELERLMRLSREQSASARRPAVKDDLLERERYEVQAFHTLLAARTEALFREREGERSSDIVPQIIVIRTKQEMKRVFPRGTSHCGAMPPGAGCTVSLNDLRMVTFVGKTTWLLSEWSVYQRAERMTARRSRK